MASQILADGTGPANSADIVVAAGTILTVALKNATRDARIIVQVKDDAGAYQPIDELNPSRNNPAVLSAPGTYRFSRAAGTCGVFSA